MRQWILIPVSHQEISQSLTFYFEGDHFPSAYMNWAMHIIALANSTEEFNPESQVVWL